MQKIASFSINHDTLTPGLYVSRIDGDVITYDLRNVGPMGCRTGFYFLTRNSMTKQQALTLLQETFAFIRDFDGEIPGAKKIECGNYLDHDLWQAKKDAAAYEAVLSGWSQAKMTYPD